MAPAVGADQEVEGARQWVDQLDRLCRRRDVTRGGLRLAWRVIGQGSKVILLHGGHGSWLHWARNLEALAQHHEVHVPDLPGYGGSDTSASLDFDGLLEVMHAGVTQQFDEREPLALVGFSFGGLVAAHLAARRKGHTCLALLGPAGHGGPRRPKGRLQPWREAAQKGDQAGLSAIMRHNLLTHMLHSDRKLDALALHIHSQSCRLTRFFSKTISHAGGLAGALSRCIGPLLLLLGEHDVTADPSWVTKTLCDAKPDLEHRTFLSCGHWAQYEAAQAVNACLLDWLSRSMPPWEIQRPGPGGTIARL